MQLIGGVGSVADEGGVAYWAHAGGFVAGIILIVPVWLREGGRGVLATHPWASAASRSPLSFRPQLHPACRATRK